MDIYGHTSIKHVAESGVISNSMIKKGGFHALSHCVITQLFDIPSTGICNFSYINVRLYAEKLQQLS